MNKALILLVVLGLQGCAHARVEEWGDGKVTVCGNARGSSKMVELAKETCGTDDITLVGGKTTRTVGSMRDVYGNNEAHTVVRGCKIYKCGE